MGVGGACTERVVDTAETEPRGPDPQAGTGETTEVATLPGGKAALRGRAQAGESTLQPDDGVSNAGPALGPPPTVGEMLPDGEPLGMRRAHCGGSTCGRQACDTTWATTPGDKAAVS